MALDPFYWLAGILEGEGTFMSGPPSRPNAPVVRISMTDRDVVERSAVLLDRAVTPLRARKAHYKPPFVTQLRGAEAVDLMLALRPVFGVERTAQIDRVLTRWMSRGGRSRPSTARFPVLDEIDGSANTDPRALSWLAGLLEGEGTFSLNCDKNGNCYPVIAVKMCDDSVVRSAARLLEAPSVTLREARRAEWRPTFVAQIGGAHAAEWMKRLRAFMGHRRTEAIDAALSQYHPIRLVDPPASCVVPGCSEPHRGRGLCHKHYMTWSRDKAKGRDARITPLR
jgi:hypothetical protein